MYYCAALCDHLANLWSRFLKRASIAVKPIVSIVLAETHKSAARKAKATPSRPTKEPMQCKRCSSSAATSIAARFS